MLSKMSFQTGRTRRTLNKNNAKKIEALERLKSLNQAGIKNRYEVEEEEKVYEEIDEDSYAELVSKRQREDWIVDDDGAGYAEHGREIFDDEYDDDDDDEQVDQIQNNRKIRNKYKLSKSKDSRKDENKKDIRNLISSMQKKNQISIANSASTSSGSKLSLKEVVINASVIDLVDSIAPKSNSSPLFNLKTTPQPLKLQKRTPTITPSSAKRKTSDISPKVNLPPFKRRSNLMTSEEFNFDEIVSEKNRCNPFAKIKSENDDKNVLNDFDLDDWSCSSLDVDEKSVNSNDASKKIEDEKKTSSAPSKAVESSSSKDGLYDEWIVSGSTNNEFKNQENLAQPFLKEIEFETDKENNKLLNFYWFDAFHDASNARNSDKIYLFGKIYNSKIQKYSSCCVQVHNLEHRIFLLPREKFLDDRVRNVQIEDVHKEFSEEVAPQLKIKHFRCRKVFKKYAFDVDSIPFEAEYLEISYPASMVQFPEKFMSGKTYRHVFGANSSILENFILDLNLMGPGWLELKNPQINDSPISWCKYEFIANDPRKQITKLSAKPATLPEPNFTILSLCFKSFVHVSTKMPEIIAISCLINRQFYLDSTDSKNNNHSKYDQHFCIVTKISNTTELPIDFNQKMALKEYKKTRIDVMNNERELLMFFMAKFQQIDPDIIIGHDIYHFDYDVLLQRFSHYKIPLQWSKLGRMKHSGLPSRIKEKHFLSGRLVCDTKILSKELIRSKSYDLTELAAQILRKGRFEIEQNLLPSYYENSSKLIRLIEFLMKDNDLILSIAFELNCLQLTKQITSIAGNLFSRTLLGGRSERNEFLLLHAFNERGYIVPDKHLSTSNSKKKASNINSIKEELDDTNLELIENDPKTINDSNKKSSYVGGLVLEPKIGYYDHFILLMDFNSLYPSIIQEYNICFTTIKSNPCSGVNEIVENVKEGILPVEIRKLVESRREVKLSLCRTDLSQNERSQLDIKQKALKITANSMYGCLGFIKSRFYAKHLASMITQKGREILSNTKELVEKMGYEVIYGDTDSIMILTNCSKYEEVKEIGFKIQAEINRLYKCLEIDIESVFRCMLLLKKKKYAALTVSRGPNQTLQYHREVKGLDIVRRDWSVISKIAGETILDEILKPDRTSEVIVDNIHQHIKQLAEKIRENKLDLENFVINKALAKRPEDYDETAKSLTHVTVALRHNQTNLGKKFVAGDTVPYVICLDGTKNAATQRGYHVDEVRKNSQLKIDIDYYLSQQLFPVISRLCEPIDGTNSGIIAEFLGIESRKINSNKSDQSVDMIITSGDSKYDLCQSLIVVCPSCTKNIEIRDLFRLWNKKSTKLDPKSLKTFSIDRLYELTFYRCQHCQTVLMDKFNEFYFELQLRKQINHLINRFNQNWMVCDDQGCSHQTRYLSGSCNQNHINCPRCFNGNLRPVVSEHLMYQQLTFFHHIFDLDHAMQRFSVLQLSDDHRARRNEIKQKFGDFIQRLQSVAQYFLDQSSYNEFDLGFLFRKFRYDV